MSRDISLTRRRWLVLSAATAAAAGLPFVSSRITAAAMLPPAMPSATDTNILRSAEPFGAPSLDPAGPTNVYCVQYGLAEALMRITPQGSLVPWLAEGIESLDALRWRVRLRPGVAFWNGRRMDSEAVRGSILRSVAKRPVTATLLDLDRIDVVDDLTLDLVTRLPNAALVSSLAGTDVLIHDADAAAAVGDDAFGNAPVATGPFIPTTFRARELTSARRNDAYWGGVPALAGVELRAVSDGNTRLAAALAGDVDMARQIPPQGVAQVRAAGLDVVSGAEAAMNHIYLNNTRPPLDDKAVRQAISLGIDRQMLVDRVLAGSGSAATGPYPSFLPFADPTPLPYDPVSARASLDQARWSPGADGVRVRDGKRLQFTLLTYPQRPELGLIATVVQAQLRDLGMDVAIQQVEQITPLITGADYDAAMWRLGTAPTADPGYILNKVYASAGQDHGQLGYTSPQLDAVVAELNTATAADDRIALALRAQQILREDVPAVFLLSSKLHIALSSQVRNFEYNPLDYYLINHTLSLG